MVITSSPLLLYSLGYVREIFFIFFLAYHLRGRSSAASPHQSLGCSARRASGSTTRIGAGLTQRWPPRRLSNYPELAGGRPFGDSTSVLVVVLCNVQGRGERRDGVQRTFAPRGLHIFVHVLTTNLKSAFLLSQAAGAHMLPRRSGSIIHFASLLSYQGGLTVPAYAAAKGGIAQMVKALANEWSKDGVRVNAVVPGYVRTDMNEKLLADPTRLRQISERIPAGRWGEPEDFAGPVVFLASKASMYVCGELVVVDGNELGELLDLTFVGDAKQALPHLQAEEGRDEPLALTKCQVGWVGNRLKLSLSRQNGKDFTLERNLILYKANVFRTLRQSSRSVTLQVATKPCVFIRSNLCRIGEWAYCGFVGDMLGRGTKWIQPN
ncbi:NAD(P)-binding protein [Pholiota conissans]|uniref:NAD(P)-binding protein n=1 Tax=Pholiota conissans TaxID=109636 RepID=A0A9P6D1K7_9AGAR|nr:NAD(P)-binding protein [Pholiota conissans]